MCITHLSSVEIGDSQVAGEKEGFSDYSNPDGHKGNWDFFMETFLNPNLPGILHGYPHPGWISQSWPSSRKRVKKKGIGIS